MGSQDETDVTAFADRLAAILGTGVSVRRDAGRQGHTPARIKIKFLSDEAYWEGRMVAVALNHAIPGLGAYHESAENEVRILEQKCKKLGAFSCLRALNKQAGLITNARDYPHQTISPLQTSVKAEGLHSIVMHSGERAVSKHIDDVVSSLAKGTALPAGLVPYGSAL